jgi:hypothetical protein
MAISESALAARGGFAPLPHARGPLSAFLLHHLTANPHRFEAPPVSVNDPIANDDFQLALYLCYELHYAPVEGIDERWEWNPSVLEFRERLERAFEHALRNAVPAVAIDEGVARTLRRLARADDGQSVSSFVERHATEEQFKELVIHRSLYQRKEADPQTWGIPRLSGGPKAALVEIQYEEYGAGRARDVHAALYADTMEAAGLDPAIGAYTNVVPGITLATVNVQTMFGLHRRWRGALVGHLALYELTSPVPSRRIAAGARRLGLGERVARFYDAHVDADAVHGYLACDVMAQGLADDEPELARDVVFGARALAHLEARFGSHVLTAWRAGRSSLRHRRPYDGWARG